MINAIERRVKARRHSYPSKAHEITARISEIHEAARPIEARYANRNWMPRSDSSYEYWTFFEASGYKLLPFEGGLADQPDWLRRDFEDFIALTDYWELVAEREYLEKRLAHVE